MRGDWYRAHLNDYDTKVYSTAASAENGAVRISVSEAFGWNMYQPFAKAHDGKLGRRLGKIHRGGGLLL